MTCGVLKISFKHHLNFKGIDPFSLWPSTSQEIEVATFMLSGSSFSKL